MTDVPRETVTSFVAALGYTPDDVSQVVVWPDLVAVGVIRRDETGSPVIAEPVGPVRDRVAVDWVTIKVKEIGDE